MAVGDITSKNNCKRSICLMTGQTAANAQPTDGAPGLTQGVPAYPNEGSYGSDSGAFYAGEPPLESALQISTSAGSGVLAGTFTLWGYHTQCGCWFPVLINGGAALAELATPGDTIRYRELLGDKLAGFDRLYLQMTAPSGTGTAFEAYLVTCRKGNG